MSNRYRYRRDWVGSLSDLTIASKSAHRRAVRNQGYKGLGAGLAVGLIVGAAAGVLLAPQSGKETRDQMAEAGAKAYRTVKEKGSEIIDAAQSRGAEVVEMARDKGSEVLDAVKETGVRLADRVRGADGEADCLEDVVVCEAVEPEEEA